MDPYREELTALQKRLQTIHTLKYFYYFMRVEEAEQEVEDLRENLSIQEIPLYNLSSFAYFATCVTYLRSFFDDKERNDISLFNLYRRLIENHAIKDAELNDLFGFYKKSHQRKHAKNLIGERLLTREIWQKFINIKSFVNDHIAHFKNEHNHGTHAHATSYENLESVLKAIDEIVYRHLPKMLYGKGDEGFDHAQVKEQVKAYLLGRFKV